MSVHELDGFWARQFAFYLKEHQNRWNQVTHMIGIPIIVVTLGVGIAQLDWRILVAGQVVGWFFQLLGHRIEGNRPALLKNPTAFVMGPLMVAVHIVEVVGIRFEFAERARRAIVPGEAPVPQTP